MKLHLPVKLRASLIAAVIAVSASVYNAYGDNHYKGAYNDNDFTFSDTPVPAAGNEYTAATAYLYNVIDAGMAKKIVALKDNGKYYIYDSVNKVITDEEWTGSVDTNDIVDDSAKEGNITFELSGSTGGMSIKGNSAFTADNIVFNSSAESDATPGKTSLTAKKLDVNETVKLENVVISAGTTDIANGASLTITNSAGEAPANKVALGAVTGEGSLAITGGTYDTDKTTSVEMAGVNLNKKGNLELTTADATITGDVAVNRLTLTDSATTVSGDVYAAGNATVDADSSLAAYGDISMNDDGTGSIVVDGKVSSETGDIFLDNGKVTGAVETVTGNVTLSHMKVTDGASIAAAGDLTLIKNSTIVDTPNDGGTPDDTSDDNAGITVTVGGNLTVNDSTITDTDMTVSGSVKVEAGATITGGSIAGAAGNGIDDITVSGADSSISGTNITGVTGSVTVEAGASITGGSITGAEGIGIDDITVSGADSSISGTNITGVTGSVTVDGGATITGGSIAGAESDGIEGIEVGTDSSISGTTITGNEGNITVENGGHLTDSTVVGGEHIAIAGPDANLTGTTITDLKGDIMITGAELAGAAPDGATEIAPIVIATKGTSEDATNDHDSAIGGSIIISDSKLSHIELTSGKDVDDNAAGTLPAGNIDINVSTISAATISTKRGAVDIDDTDITGSTISTGAGAVDIDAFAITGSTISTGAGAVDIDDTAITGSTISTESGDIAVNNAEITNSSVTTKNGDVTIEGTKAAAALGNYTGPISSGNKHDKVGSFKTTMEKLGLVSGKKVELSAIQLKERQDSDATVKNSGVRLVVSDASGNVVAKSVNTLDVKRDGADLTFTFAPGTVLDASAEYTFTFEDANGPIYEMTGFSSVNDNSATHYNGNGEVRHSGWSIAVKATGDVYEHLLLGSTISTESGALSMTNTYTAASTGEGAKDTVLKATDDSTITNSMLDGGTDVTIKNGSLTISGSKLLDDVNLSAEGNMVLNVGTTVAIDGGDEHDASVIAGGNLNMGGDGAIAGNVANIANADVQVGDFTTIYKDGTLNLTNVYKKGEGDAKEASKLGYLKADAEVDNRGSGTLNIDGSVIEISGIRAGGNNEASHFTGATDDNIKRYFGTVNVSGESDVKVTEGKSLIQNLNVEGTSTVSLKNAYLDNTTIDGTSTVKTVGASKLDAVNIADGGTIRVTETGTDVTTLANLNLDSATTGTVNVEVVNANLDTPVVGERVVLGLSGGVLELKDVAAHGSALAASTATVTPHVVLAAVTNAGVENAAGGSTIKTAGLNRVAEMASASEGSTTPVAGTQCYLYTAKSDFTVTAGMDVCLKDATTGKWEKVAVGETITAGTEVGRLNYTVTDTTEVYNKPDSIITGITVDKNLINLPASLVSLLDPKTAVDQDNQVAIDTQLQQNGMPVYQVAENISGITYQDGVSATPGAPAVMDDGIASLTVKGDFGADKVDINAYQLAEPVAYWKDGQAYTVDQYKAMLAGGSLESDFTPEYKESATVYYTISNTAFSGVASDGTYTDSDKAIYTQLNSVYTGTIKDSGLEKLSDADKAKFTYNEDGHYMRTITTQADFDALTDKSAWVGAATNEYTYTNTVDQTGYDALTDQTGYVDNGDGTYTYTNTVDQTGYDALADTTGYVGAADNTFTHTLDYTEWEQLADASQYEYQKDGTYTTKETITNAEYRALSADERAEYVKIADDQYIRSITGEVAGSLAAEDIVGGTLDENERWYTTIVDGTNTGDWFEETIQSECDGAGYTNTFVNADGLHYVSDKTGHIVIEGALSGSENVLAADTYITTGDITGSKNELLAGENISTGAITGSENALTGESIVTGAIGSADGNTLTATTGSIETGAIDGNYNALMAGENITTGAINGYENLLSAATGSIETGAITSATGATAATDADKGNTLTAAGDITVDGAITGDCNKLTATEGSILVTNASTGSYNKLTAGGNISIGDPNASGKHFAGTGNEFDADGYISVRGRLQGNNNILTAGGEAVTSDGYAIRINGGIQANDKEVVATGNKLTATTGDIYLGMFQWVSVTGNENHITATTGAIKLDGSIKGDDNTLTAGTSISTGDITGDDNVLDADTTITTGAITSDTDATAKGQADKGNTLTAAGDITVGGTITGDCNELTSDEGRIQTGAITGDYNTLDAADDITVDGAINGSDNELTAGTSITTGAITGDDNVLDADTTITTGAITSADNATAAGEEGKGNTLTASGAIETGAITGDCNELTSQTGSITLKNNAALDGEYNTLQAETSITTGAITGDENELTAGTTITVNGKLDGNSNKLLAENGDVNLNATTCSLEGDGNTITATGGDVNIKDDVMGDRNVISGENILSYVHGGTAVWASLKGNSNVLTANKAIRLDTVEGFDNELTAGTTITTGAITSADDATAKGQDGKGNTLTAAGDITVGGAITGDCNELTSDEGRIQTGAITGDYNELTAAQHIFVNGMLKGDGNTVISNGTVPTNEHWNININSGIGASEANSNGNEVTAEKGNIRLGISASDGVYYSLGGANNVITAKTGDILLGDANEEGRITNAGIIVGDNNTLAAGKRVMTGAITGDDNTLTAGEFVDINGTLIGSGNTITAATPDSVNGDAINIQTGIGDSAAESDNNTLIATTGNITLGHSNYVSLGGDNNTLTATTGAIKLDSYFNGDENTLTAGKYVDINGMLVGSNNNIEAASTDGANGAINIQYGIGGQDADSNDNTLTATTGDIVLGASRAGNVSLGGDNNTLTATADAIKLSGSIKGSDNTLTAGTSITTGAITGDVNTLTATGDITTGQIDSADNATGYQVAGENIGNTLESAEGNITVDSIAGDSNTLTAEEGAITVTNDIVGRFNKLTGETVTVDDVQGSNNTVTGEKVTIDELAGANQVIRGGADDADTVVIDITTMTATNSTVEVVSASGSIHIGTLTGTELGTGTRIKTVNGGVSIDTLDTVAKTEIEADSITVGSGSASNQTWDADSLTITGADGIALTDSLVTVGEISGTTLTLSGNTTVDATTVTLGTLTLDGSDVTVDVSTLTVNDVLELKGGATMGNIKITTDADGATLQVTNSKLHTADLVGFTGVILDNSTGNLGGASLGTADKPMTEVTAQNGSELAAGSIYSSGAVTADDSKITISGDITANSMTIANGGSIAAADVTLNGALDAAGGKLTATSVTGATDATLAAGSSIAGDLGMGGELEATGSSIGGSVTGATDATLNGSSIAGDLGMAGELSMSAGAAADSVTGATNATLNGAEIDGALSMDANAANANVTATGGTVIGSIANADNVTLETASKVKDDVDMNGKLIMSGVQTAIAGSVTGATSAELTGSIIKGDLNVTTGTVEADGGSIGSISGTASSVDLIGTQVGGIAMDGELSMSAGAAADSVTGATNATLNGSSIAGDLDASGEVAATGGSIGSISGTATGVDLSGTQVGDITMDGELSMSAGAAADSVTGATDATLTNATITGDLGASGEVAATGGSIGSITGAATKVDLDGTTVGDITMSTAGNLTVSNTTTGAVNTATDNTVANATLTNAIIGSDLNVTNDMTTTGAVTVKGDVTVGNDLSVNTGKLTADNVTVDGTTTLTSGTVDVAGTFHSTEVILKNIDGEMAELKADKGLSLSGAEVAITGTGAEAVKVAEGGMTLTNGAEVTNAGGASITGGLTVAESTFSNEGALNLNAGGMTATAGSSVTAKGGITNAGAVEVSYGAEVITGTIAGATTVNVTNEGKLIGSVTDATAVTVTGENSSIQGSVTGASGLVTVTDGDVTGSVTTQGGVTVTGAEASIGGTVNAGGAVSVNGGSTGAVTVSNDAVSVSNGGTIAGDVEDASTVDVTTGAMVTGSVTDATDAVTVTDGMILGSVTGAADVSVSGDDGRIGGDVAAGGDVTVSDYGVITGDVDADGAVTVTNGSIDGTVTAGDAVTLNGGYTGSVNAGAAVTLNGGTITGDVDAAGAVKVNGGSVTGDVDTDGDVTVAGGVVNGAVSGAGVTLTGASVGSVDATGDVALNGGAVIGNLDAAGDVTITGGVINGALAADGATSIQGVKTVQVGSATVNDLSIASTAGLTSTGAAGVTANGALDIKGDITAAAGNISLTGTGNDSAITDADVTAEAGNVVIGGTVAATDAKLTGEEIEIIIGGTLAAGKGVSFDGTVKGAGSIVKTGGDTLVLAGDTEIGGVKVIDSTLDAGDGAKLGALNLEGATMQIAGEKNIGAVEVNGGSMNAATTVVADVKLGQRSGSDQISNSGVMEINGAVVKLNDLGTNEANVADQTSLRIVTGTVTGVGFNADVEHNYDTLNVHAEGGEIVFSKNYKGAANKTENQAATADALAALTTPDGELAGVMDALAHTRSEADALKALDSLSGAGLAAAPKLITDETQEHLQTLRSTLQSVAAGLQRRYTATGVRLSDVESTAVSASVTGGSATVNEDGNAAEYNRDSIGAMFTAAHAINDEWTFGAAIAFSAADADCGETTIESNGVFLDLALMHKRGRFAQMGSVGCAFFSMDTERTVGVNAPGHGFAGKGEGSTDATAFTMSYETTYAIWQTESYSLSSVVMAEALFAQVDNMEEDGLGNAGLRSSFDDVASLSIGAGARYTYHFGEESNPGYFSAEAMFVADAGDSTTKVNNAFIGGGNSFQLSGPEAGSYGLRLNAGLLVPLGDQWGLFGNVTSEFRSEQTTVGGSAGLKYTF